MKRSVGQERQKKSKCKGYKLYLVLYAKQPVNKLNLHVTAAGNGQSAKWPWGHCVQVTSHWGLGVNSEVRYGPPRSLVSGERRVKSYLEAVRLRSPPQ